MQKKTIFIFFIFQIFFACSDLGMQMDDFSGIAVVQDFNEKVEENTIFYYCGDEKIYLYEKKNTILIHLSECIDKENFLTEIGNNISFLDITYSGFKDNFAVLESPYGAFSNETIQYIKKMPGVIHVSYLSESNGYFYAPTNYFIVKLNDSSDYSRLKEDAEAYLCAVTESTSPVDDTFILTLSNDSSKSMIEVANIFHEAQKYNFVSPEFYFFDALHSSDTYYSIQWNLLNSGQYGSSSHDININPAWLITEGSEEVIVAVIDNGVDLQHPDLLGQLLPGYDALEGITQGGKKEDESESDDYGHGTSVVGIIGAIKDNNEGIAGVAPGCRIIPIRAFGQLPYSSNHVVNSIDWAVSHGADVINCSNGGFPSNDNIISAINRATTEGRDGKGCIVVVSAGNQRSSLTFPATLSNVISVGACRHSGYRLADSNYGPGLDVVAPGENIVTTDIIGAEGYNISGNSQYPADLPNLSYTRYFDGTSAAAPHVSGIAALILSEYPDLTESQVRRAIELGCTRPSGYSYSNDNRYPVGLWNQEVGYGIVDAYASLMKANTFHLENVANSIPGIDFIIRNESSYALSNIYVGLTGVINGVYTSLISCDPGSLNVNQAVGFPTYRGEDILASPGTTISEIELEFYAETTDFSGNLRMAVHIDGPGTYDLVNFGSGNTVNFSIADTTVPDASRKRLVIEITNPLNR